MSKSTYEELESTIKELRRMAFSARRNSHNCGPFQYSDLCEEIIDITELVKGGSPMTALNKQALREAAQEEIMLRSVSDTSDAWQDEASPEAVLALLDELKSSENNLIDSECHVAELEEALRDKQALLEALDNSLCEILPGTQYMDPPDGGSVTPLEQVRRMVADYQDRIAVLSASHSKLRDTMATIHNTIRMDGGYTPLAAILNAAKRAHDESATAAGIGVKGE